MSKKNELESLENKASTIRELKGEEAEVVSGAVTGEIMSRYFSVRVNDATGKGGGFRRQAQ